MAKTYRHRFLGVLKRNEREMTDMFTGLSNELSGIVTAYAVGEKQLIPPDRAQQVRKAAQAAVTKRFLIATGGGDMAAFDVVGGRVIPLSPYMRILWRNISEASLIAVQRHGDTITSRLQDKAPAVLGRMRRATGNPFAEAKRQIVAQTTGAVWRPNPFARYDPPHLWIDPRGYRLSDRIWQTTVEIRRKIDLLIEQAIRDGRSAFALAKDLEVFLQPGRSLLRTDRPYGRDASADAMRLARTEITRAHAQADVIAANMNPFVESFNVVLSGSHPKTDVCDIKAEGGPYPKSEEGADIPPFHPHCLCSIRWNVSENAGAVIEDLRKEAERQRSLMLDLVGPVLLEQFTTMLLRQLEVFAPPDPVPFP